MSHRPHIVTVAVVAVIVAAGAANPAATFAVLFFGATLAAIGMAVAIVRHEART